MQATGMCSGQKRNLKELEMVSDWIGNVWGRSQGAAGSSAQVQ